jgi:PHD/YefM family antitoxin component YafN of YafNO toxin-antitoxin module
MKYTLEIPDQEAEFVLELLRRVTSVKLTPIRSKAAKQDTTEYLLSNPANARELMESIAQARRGEVVSHDLLSAE